jgi:hypothetical protein
MKTRGISVSLKASFQNPGFSVANKFLGNKPDKTITGQLFDNSSNLKSVTTNCMHNSTARHLFPSLLGALFGTPILKSTNRIYLRHSRITFNICARSCGDVSLLVAHRSMLCSTPPRSGQTIHQELDPVGRAPITAQLLRYMSSRGIVTGETCETHCVLYIPVGTGQYIGSNGRDSSIQKICSGRPLVYLESTHSILYRFIKELRSRLCRT